MVFLIWDFGEVGSLLAVSAESEDEVKERLILKPSEKIVGRLTDTELDVLSVHSFGVVTA